MSEDRITSTNSYIGEARQEAGLRPQTLDDYIGQQGPGGTPFPFIRNIYITQDDELVVVCIVNEGLEAFWFNSKGQPLYDIVVKFDDIPNPYEEKSGITLHMEAENIVPDMTSHTLFVKADYFETAVDENSKAQAGISYKGSYVFPLDCSSRKYGEGLPVPPYEDFVADGFSKQIYNLPYDFLGVTENGWLFFTIATERGMQVQMIHKNGNKTLKRLLQFDTENVVYESFHLSLQGIISALLAQKDSVHVVWWRTDSLLDAILKS